MEIVSENDQEIGVVFTLREFRILLSLLGRCMTGSNDDAAMSPVWNAYAFWAYEKYKYFAPVKCPTIKYTVEEDKLFEMQSM